jgi:hypothetical protein
MGHMTVHRYRIADSATGEWVVQLSKASEAHIKKSVAKSLPTRPSKWRRPR